MDTTRTERVILAIATAALGIIALLAIITATPAIPGTHAQRPSKGRFDLVACKWSYHYTISTLAAGGTARLWINNNTGCGTGWPEYRAALNCAYTKPGLGTYNAYGPWRRPAAVSQAGCNASSVPNYLNENLIFANGSRLTLRDWTR